MSLEFLVVVLVVAYLGFFVSSTAGIGGALLLTPAMLMVLPAAPAIGLVATVLFANNLFKTIAFARYADRRAAILTALGALPFAVLGAVFTDRIDERVLRVLIAVIVLASLAVELGLRRPVPVGRRGLPVMGAGFGFISGLCGLAGPLAAITYKGYGLDRERFVGTISVVAFGMQAVKIPAYLATGVLTLGYWPLALSLMVVSLAGVLSARRLLLRMDARRFRVLLNLFLVIVAGMMVYQAVFPPQA